MRNWAVVAAMTVIGLAVITWVAWPEGDSSAVEESTPRTRVSAPAPLPNSAPNHTSNNVPSSESDHAPPTTAALPTSAPADGPTSAAALSTGAADGAAAYAAPRTQRRCEAQCDKDNGQCNSEARQSRQVCSRNAANGGNNPFSGRPESFDYYCGYFDIAECGSRDCAARLAQRYAECVQVMRGDIISRRFDCMRAQDEAQSLCREELRDCRAQCE